MAVYRITIAGHVGTVLVKAEGLRDAYKRVITACDPLNTDEMETALTAGEKVWRDGEPFPVPDADAVAEAASELEYLKWFENNADFGPGHGDALFALQARYTEQTGNAVPEAYQQEE